MKENKSVLKSLWFWVVIAIITAGVYLIPLYIIYLHRTSEGGFNYGEPGTIGDTFGMVAPFINLGGAVFVYLAFREQLKANALLQRQIDETKNDDVFRSQYETLEKRINKVTDTDINHLDLYSYEAIEETTATIVNNFCQGKGTLSKEYGEDVLEICSMINGIEKYREKHKVSEQEDLFTGTLYKATVRKFILSIGKGYKRNLDAQNCKVCNGKHKLPYHFNKFLMDNARNFLVVKDIADDNNYMDEFVGLAKFEYDIKRAAH